MYYLCTYKLIVYSNYYRRKGRVRTLAFFYVLTVCDCIHTVSCAGLHGSKRLLSNRVMAVRRLFRNQKTVYDLKLLVIFLKKSVMFFKKLVVFYQSLADLCYSPVCSLIIYKLALDKIRMIQDIKEYICQISSTSWRNLLNACSTLPIGLSFMWLIYGKRAMRKNVIRNNRL